MMSGQSRFLPGSCQVLGFDANHGPKIFRCGESGATNPAKTRPRIEAASRLRHLSATWDAVGNQPFVDRDRRFGLYKRRTSVALFGVGDAEHRADTRCG